MLFLDVRCEHKKLDILFIVDGSGSFKLHNFDKIKEDLKQIVRKFDIGPNKVQVALMQFGKVIHTRVEFNLGEKTSLQAVLEGIENMKYMRSFATATGDALKKSGKLVRLLYVLKCQWFLG